MSSFFLFLLTTLADKPAMLSRFIYRLHLHTHFES